MNRKMYILMASVAVIIIAVFLCVLKKKIKTIADEENTEIYEAICYDCAKEGEITTNQINSANVISGNEMVKIAAGFYTTNSSGDITNGRHCILNIEQFNSEVDRNYLRLPAELKDKTDRKNKSNS